jgi:hypothetical protein
MDTSSYDAKIQAAAAEKAALYSQVEAASRSFMQACVDFFRKDFRRRIESAVTEDPETTQSLGIEKLRALKSELNELVSKVPDIVSERLDRPDVWEHRKPIPETQDTFDLRFRAGNNAHDELREVFGYFGQLLVKYGFETTGKDSAWESRPKAPPRYKYGMTLSKEIDEAFKTYKNLFERFVNAHQQQLRIENEKEQAIARDLWDRA